MRVCVMGLWHLGTVTAACLASGGHQVTGLDDDGAVVERLKAGEPGFFEPGLADLVKQGKERGLLRFTTEAADALGNAEVLWVCYDTPVDENDRADVDHVVSRVKNVFHAIKDGTLVVVSSQLPVGSTALLEHALSAARPGLSVGFACLPENLRLGDAIRVFTRPDRVVAGTRSDGDRKRIADLLRPFTENLVWMSVESAEMTKHAINAFLATSIAFTNEVAILCEGVGADAKEVERGLKSESRIGPKAYVAPGAAFTGGTLARDVVYLAGLGESLNLPARLLSAVSVSNSEHKSWIRRKLAGLPGGLAGKRVAVLGLAYKPGTDIMRRSSSVELCDWLASQGVRVAAHDPKVKQLPSVLASRVELCADTDSAIRGSSALVVATEWPDYRELTADGVVALMAAPVVVDPNRFLARELGGDSRIAYTAVGAPGSRLGRTAAG